MLFDCLIQFRSNGQGVPFSFLGNIYNFNDSQVFVLRKIFDITDKFATFSLLLFCSISSADESVPIIVITLTSSVLLSSDYSIYLRD